MSDKSKVQVYAYLDEDGLDSLYAQCSEFIVERLTEIEQNGKLEATLEAKLGKLLSVLGAEAGIEGSLLLDRMRTDSLRSVVRVEQRIPVILEYLRATGDLQRLSHEDHPAAVSEGFTLFDGLFVPPRLSDLLDQMSSPAAFMAGRPAGFAQFSADPAFGRIVMGASHDKFKLGLHHLLLMWPGPKVILTVFGTLTQTGDAAYYLKPFTIAQGRSL